MDRSHHFGHDAVPGVSAHTETLLRQALGERIRPIVAIDQLDRGFLELQLDWESMYTQFVRHVADVNAVISPYHDDAMGDLRVRPEDGTVGFSAGPAGWAFTIPMFGRMYAKKFGVPEDKMTRRLWGDHFFNPEERRWSTQGEPSHRAFNLFVADPIGKVFSACMNGQVGTRHGRFIAIQARARSLAPARAKHSHTLTHGL